MTRRPVTLAQIQTTVAHVVASVAQLTGMCNAFALRIERLENRSALLDGLLERVAELENKRP